MRLLATFLLLIVEVLGASAAFAQAAPFSMGQPSAQAPKANPSAAGKTAPFEMAPGRAAPSALSSRSGEAASGAAFRPLSTGATATRQPIRIERPVLPFQSLRFEGETDARSWAFHLTEDEASSGAAISVGYQNAIVVMPEASRLRVIINGETVIDAPISSADDIRIVMAPIRPGLLRTGQNIIRMEALQRHRTDCTAEATYELWTDVSSASTRLIFAEGATKTLRSLDDLPAVGVDATGATTIRVVAPRIYRPEIRDRLLRLVQLIALRGRYAHPVVQVVETDPGPSPVGTIKVVMGLAGELRELVAGVPDAAASQPITMMLQEPGTGGSTLVVSGPTWSDLDTAIGIVGGSTLDPGRNARRLVDTASWLWPEVPNTRGDETFRLADLGVPTQEFSGRRLKAQFSLDLPPDFYATEYAEATLYLDAAYTSAVRPGSHVDIYVNGKISTTMTITAQGDIVRRHTIRVPMKNFESGLNHIALEVVLQTDADERCAPGETLSETNRFVLFDTTALEIPAFGRIGMAPDLGVLSTGKFPYGDLPTTVVLARLDPQTYSAAGTLLARMAKSAGMPVKAQFSSAAGAEEESLLYVGAVDQLPAGLLNRVHVSEHLRMLWPSTPLQTSEAGQQFASAEFSFADAQTFLDRSMTSSTDEIRTRWSETFQRRGFLQQAIGSLKDWMEQTFHLSLSSLSLGERPDAPYEPPQRASLLIAQSRVEGGGTWTLVTARTEAALAQEMSRMSDPMLWSQVSGQAVALDPQEAQLVVQPIRNYAFVQTQSFSLLNLRMVAANWMSGNILQYALLMLACCAVLGAATYLLLNRLGRS